MRKNLVMTVTGNDRVGIVEEVTKLILAYDGNVDASRMSRLGGEFAMLVLVSVPSDKFKGLRQGVRDLRQLGFKVTTRETERGYSAKYAGWVPYQVKVTGADHEGIIHDLTRYLAQEGINIEMMDTGMVPAPMSGTPLFTMTAVVLVPPKLTFTEWRDDLEEVADKLNVDTEVTPYTGY
ncbi:MAG: ACT domain-containing protein [Chloroflexota bacterium]